MPTVRSAFSSVRKRDGRIVPFNPERITNAIIRAMQAAGESGNILDHAAKVTDHVLSALSRLRSDIPCIEDIQDNVERELLLMDFHRTAKQYILYRRDRARVRESAKEVPEKVKKLTDYSRTFFRNALAEFIYVRTYARWIPEEGRRETWVETVDRYVDFMRERLGSKLSEAEYIDIREAILNMEVMPSMRLMWSAGDAARKNNASAYNCTFIRPTCPHDIAEIMYLGMSGCGVGFSVESSAVDKFPSIERQRKYFAGTVPTHVVEDSREGWCRALEEGLDAWLAGRDLNYDLTQLRPAGARLKTMGGQSSGPEPLRECLAFARQKILSRQGRKLRPIDLHDIICKIGEVTMAGGVRRNAYLSLSDLDDVEMREAKTGQFYLTEGQRSMANNSAVYEEKPSSAQFLEEWTALAGSGTGERGIFNRGSLPNQIPNRRLLVDSMGTNPCAEILLRSKQTCNLSEVVLRSTDTTRDIVRKVRVATILGTYQSTFTDFSFLSPEWKKNCEEERLLGVSLTGQWDCPHIRRQELLQALKAHAVAVNREYADRFGIAPSTAITCVKPSGTVSQLTDASSGMHPRYAPYYIRRVRINATDPLFLMLKDQKYPYHAEVGQSVGTANTYVLEFPVRAPEGSTVGGQLSALEQLEHWKLVKTAYTEHNPSQTINVSEDEWIETADWVYRNWEIIGGLSFLPRSSHVYQLAPYEEITQDQYNSLVEKLPKIDFSKIVLYEKEDTTQGSQELACSAGACSLDDLPVETSTHGT